jgi:cysteine desulfurase
MIYLDNNATTRPLPSVVEVIRESTDRFYGNPSSQHSLGIQARRLLEEARTTVASGLGAHHSSQIILTSGGTESINLAFSLLPAANHRQILISAVEHHAVSAAAQRWAGGRTVREIPVDDEGRLDLDYLASALKSGPAFVSLMFANNETGVIFDLASICRICRQSEAFLHIDATQAAGRIPLNLHELGCDAASFSAHKFHGPKGAGLLYVRSVPQHPQILLPGHQESGLRGGTENLPAILGAAEAVKLIPAGIADADRQRALRDKLEAALVKAIPGGRPNGGAEIRLPQTTNFFFPSRNAADLVARLARRNLCVSAGAACSTGRSSSHVLRAMGFPEERANGSIRISLSRLTTEQEINQAIDLICETYRTTLPLLSTGHPFPIA